MVGTVVFALTFQSLSGDLPPHSRVQFANREGEQTYLGPMTRLFRQAYRNVFAGVRSFAIPDKVVETSAARLQLMACMAFSTTDEGVLDCETPDRLLVFIAKVTPQLKGSTGAEVWREHYRTVEAKLELVRAFGLGDLLDCCANAPNQILGQTSIVLDFRLGKRESCVAAIFAFYVLAWLRALRIERRQMSTKFSPIAAMSLSGGREIAQQRLRIIDQQRYFLTGDRSNDMDMRKFCEALLNKYKLNQRLQRSLELHQAFEHHLDNSAKLHSARQLGSVSNLILILTILTVPIGFLGAVFAINLNSDAFTRPWQLLADYRLYVAFLLGIMLGVLPFGLLKVFDKFRFG